MEQGAEPLSSKEENLVWGGGEGVEMIVIVVEKGEKGCLGLGECRCGRNEGAM